MTKEDLKHGNVVETREGFRYLYIIDKNNYYDGLLFNLDGKDFDKSINNYRYDLIYELGNHHLDIMKVYKNYTCQELLWERKEKPYLTDDEKVILKNLDKKYKYISRNSDGYLFVTTTAGIITAGSNVNLIVFNHLFQFIKCEEGYLIEDLLKA